MRFLFVAVILIVILLIPIQYSLGSWWEFEIEPEINYEDECFFVFADFFDLLYNMIFYATVFNASYDTDLPYDLQNSIEYDFVSLQNDFRENECEKYRYLLEDDDYLSYRYTNFEYNIELYEWHVQNYHNDNKSSGLTDKILEHKDLIKKYYLLC